MAALAGLLAQVVELAGARAIFPGQWEALAEQAMEHHSVHVALAVSAEGRVVSTPHICQLDETRANLETLTGSLGSAGPIKAGAARELACCGDAHLRPPVHHAVMTGDDQRLIRPLTPGEALAKLFMANADQNANAANDELVAALSHRARTIQAPAHRTTPHLPRPDTTPQQH